jgi:hypothetical protein
VSYVVVALYVLVMVTWLGGMAALPLILLWLVVRAVVRLMRRRRGPAFAWQPRDWGAAPLGALEVRVSTRDRDRAAADLVRHWHQGRLTVEELDQRVGRALAARTRGELELLRADLP